MGIGTWAWGDRYWGWGKDYGEAEAHAAYTTSINHGITFFDTAEIYGWGKSERVVGKLAHQSEQQVFLASKFFPFPWRISKRQFIAALRGSMRRLRVGQLDLYQIHWPLRPISINAWMEAMAVAVEKQLIKAIGVSNFDLEQTQEAMKALAPYGLSLASNQIEYNLLERSAENNGLRDYCREHNIAIIAYSPLKQGLLTGKYSTENPPHGVRRYRFRNSYLEKIMPVIETVQSIGEQYDKTPAQVALNWVMCQGAIPIPGAKNAQQAQDNLGALGWRLADEDLAQLNMSSESLQFDDNSQNGV